MTIYRTNIAGPEFDRLARILAYATHKARYVEIIRDSAEPPREVGEEAHYTNRSGDRIYHPGAYSKKGWSSLCYQNSTVRIRVGELWLLANVDLAEYTTKPSAWQEAKAIRRKYETSKIRRDRLAETKGIKFLAKLNRVSDRLQEVI